MLHNPAAISAPRGSNGGSILPIVSRQEYIAVLNTLLALLAVAVVMALLAVAVVMAVHGVVRLLSLPFRVVRALFQRSPAQSQITA